VRMPGSLHRVPTLLALLALAFMIAGCGPSSWSVSPVVWGPDEGGGVVLEVTQVGTATEVVSEDGSNAVVFGRITFYSEDEPDEPLDQAAIRSTSVLVTDRTACMIDDEAVDVGQFVTLMAEAQDQGTKVSLTVKYEGDQATELRLRYR